MKNQCKTICLLLLLYPSILIADEWYEGGTLHRATAQQWHDASSENRLATAADFAASADTSVGLNELRERASALQICISTATSDSSLGSLKVAEVAAVCIIQLGYR